MPNWCENHLCITGPAEQRARFVKDARGTPQRYGPGKNQADQPATEMLCFHKLYPVPEELLRRSYGARKEHEKDLPPVDGCRSGLEWERGRWGCKWGVGDCHCQVDVSPDQVEYRFLTPWTPPTGFLEHVSTMFPELRFDLGYSEPGCGFEGRFVVCNGAVESDESRSMV